MNDKEYAQQSGSLKTPRIEPKPKYRIDPLKSGLLCANGGPKKCRVTCEECRQIFDNHDAAFKARLTRFSK